MFDGDGNDDGNDDDGDRLRRRCGCRVLFVLVVLVVVLLFGATINSGTLPSPPIISPSLFSLRWRPTASVPGTRASPTTWS